MMDEEATLEEKIKVLAIFGGGKYLCQPLKFQRPNGQEIVIGEIGLIHPTRHGRRMVHIFDVTDGRADYRLELDAESLAWRLLHIKDEYGA
jgi:hypothetical protein